MMPFFVVFAYIFLGVSIVFLYYISPSSGEVGPLSEVDPRHIFTAVFFGYIGS